MPVASIKSGSTKGGFSIPRLPCRYFLFWLQCLGTGTLFRYACSSQQPSHGNSQKSLHCGSLQSLDRCRVSASANNQHSVMIRPYQPTDLKVLQKACISYQPLHCYDVPAAMNSHCMMRLQPDSSHCTVDAHLHEPTATKRLGISSKQGPFGYCSN